MKKQAGVKESILKLLRFNLHLTKEERNEITASLDHLEAEQLNEFLGLLYESARKAKILVKKYPKKIQGAFNEISRERSGTPLLPQKK